MENILAWLETKIKGWMCQHSNPYSKDSDFTNALWFDSLDSVELIIAAEEEYDIDLYDHEICDIKTPNDLAILIDKKVNFKR